MRLSILSLVMWVLTASAVAQTYSVRGKVIDGKTREPLPGANVFIAGTTKGVASSADGSFVLTGLPVWPFKLVVSFVGYETQAFDVQPERQVTYTVALTPSENILREIVVRSRRVSGLEWASRLAKFKDHFIGRSENARYCKLENAHALAFDVDGGMFTALADSTLVIRNEGLGYRAKVALNQFLLDENSQQLRYDGYMVYEPLTPKNENQRARWAKARLKAYYGSEMHFFRSLYAHRLTDEGFFVELYTEDSVGNKVVRQSFTDTVLSVVAPIYGKHRIKIPTIAHYNRLLDSTSSKTLLAFQGNLEVKFYHEQESLRAPSVTPGRVVSSVVPQTSRMRLLRPKPEVQPNGLVFPPDGVETQGHWGWDLMAESLPSDYDPTEDLLLTGKAPQR